MKCPYCGKEMELGRLHSSSGRAVFWLPDNTEYKEGLITKKKIEEYGKGVILDTVSKVGFFSKKKPKSYWCNNCKVFITKKI